jgi:PIN domain nuclease of toxin-antitoxin system
MKLLIDTHALIWFAEADSRLSSNAKKAIELSENSKAISMATLWEMAIKMGLGKLHLSRPLSVIIPEIEANGFDLLPIKTEHVLQIEVLPYFHRDPFDRMLIGQALAEDMVLVSNEDVFDQYGVNRLW